MATNTNLYAVALDSAVVPALTTQGEISVPGLTKTIPFKRVRPSTVINIGYTAGQVQINTLAFSASGAPVTGYVYNLSLQNYIQGTYIATYNIGDYTPENYSVYCDGTVINSWATLASSFAAYIKANSSSSWVVAYTAGSTNITLTAADATFKAFIFPKNTSVTMWAVVGETQPQITASGAYSQVFADTSGGGTYGATYNLYEVRTDEPTYNDVPLMDGRSNVDTAYHIWCNTNWDTPAANTATQASGTITVTANGASGDVITVSLGASNLVSFSASGTSTTNDAAALASAINASTLANGGYTAVLSGSAVTIIAPVGVNTTFKPLVSYGSSTFRATTVAFAGFVAPTGFGYYWNRIMSGVLLQDSLGDLGNSTQSYLRVH